MDSEVPYLNYVTRPETIKLNDEQGIEIVKIGGGCTESSQALDVGNCFMELTSKIGELTLKGATSDLKERFTRRLKECEIFKCKNKGRRTAIIDAVSIAPEAYKNAFTQRTIQGGFGNSGDITNLGDGIFVTCPDLLAMRNLCKIDWTEIDWEAFVAKVPAAVHQMLEHGFLSEEWCDENCIPIDSMLDGVEIEKNVTLDQLHMQRHMILYHKSIRDHFHSRHEIEIRAKQEKQDQRYRIAAGYL